MAVYTDVSEGELAAFLRQYDIGELRSYKGIAEGSENSNYLLATSQGAFILTLYEKRVEQADLPFFLGLMEHLAGKGVTCPLPVHRRDGEVVGRLAGRAAALITFLDGMWMRKPTVGQCREVGKALAELHIAGADFALTRRNALQIDGWRKLWAGARDRADEVEPGLVAEVDRDFAELQRVWPGDLRRASFTPTFFPTTSSSWASGFRG